MKLITNIIYLLFLLLFIFFIYLIIKIYLNKGILKNPPIPSMCPNYYIPKNIMGRKICKARHIYNVNENCEKVDITNLTQEDKCKWSKDCDVYWEGITNKKINNIHLC